VKLVGPKGELVDLPEEQAAAAWKSGQYTLPGGAPVPIVGSDGTVGTVDPEHAQAVIDGGGRFASAQELHKATVDAKYGGLGGQVVAGAEGIVRGATLGLSDPLAVGAGRLFGGDAGAEKVREHLKGETEANPWTSTLSELGGAALPTLLTGGAGGAAEVTEAAGVVAKIGEGVRALGAAPRGVMAAGDAAEHMAAQFLGSAATDGALSTAAKGAAKAAVKSIVEGGLFGAGSEISQGTLDNDLTAEKVVASAGHGAFLAGVLGAGGSLLGSGVAHALGANAEKLDDAAGQQAWNWLAAGKKLSEEAEQRAGGTAAVGRVLFDDVLRPLVEEKGLAGAAVDHEEKLDLIRKAIDKKGAQIGDLVRGYEGTTVPLAKMLGPIDALEAKYAKMVGGEDKVAAMQKLRNSVMRVLGGAPEETANVAAAPKVARSPQEVAAYLRANPEAAKSLAATGKLPEEAAFLTPSAPAPANFKISELKVAEPWSDEKLAAVRQARAGGQPLEPIRVEPGDHGELIVTDGIHRVAAAREAGETMIPGVLHDPNYVAPATAVGRATGEGEVPLAEAMKQRRSLQQIAYQETKALDPNLRVELLRDVTRAWGDTEEAALNEASRGMPKLAGDRLKELNGQYQKLKIAERASETNLARYATNRNLSLTDYMMGAAHAPAAIMAGHPLAAAGALASSFGHKFLREHGNAYSAIMLDRLSTWGGVSRAAAEVDAQIERHASEAVSSEPIVMPKLRARAFHRDDTGDRYDTESARVRQVAAVAPALLDAHLKKQNAPLATHAPALAASVAGTVKTGTAFLASKLPPQPPVQPSLSKTAGVPAPMQAEFLRYVDAVQGGPQRLAKRVANGTVTREDIEANKAVFGKSYEALRTTILGKAATAKGTIPLQKRINLAMLGGAAEHPLFTPAFTVHTQAAYAASAAKAQHAKPSERTSKASNDIMKNMQSQTERAMMGTGK
jgi:hypothetical protein